MKTIGVLIGTTDEPVSNKYYKSNKNKLKCLKEYDIYSDFIPYDYAIFAEIKHIGNKNIHTASAKNISFLKSIVVENFILNINNN